LIARTFASAVCLILSPLLVGQESTSIRVPKDTKIELVSLENTSSEFAFMGAPVRFAVAKDVVVNGVTVLHAGAPVKGAITEFKGGMAHRKWASLTIRVREIQISTGVDLRLTASHPEWRAKPGDYLGCALVLPECIVLEILVKEGCREDSCPRGRDSDGQQALLPKCVSEEFWVKSAVTIPSAALDDEKAAASTYTPIPCARIVDRGTIFGQPGISFVEFK